MEHFERCRLLARGFGVELPDLSLERLDRYAEWLSSEALDAGGIGPNEPSELYELHLGDSLTWLQPLDASPPESVLDVGSGVGLPGIPLAIALPETHVTLLDRSGRRIGLLRRAVRVLDLDNVEVLQSDVNDVADGAEVVTSRASLPPDALLPHLQRLARRLGIVAGSRRGPVSVLGYETVKIESSYLTSPRWLLIMRQS